MNKSVFITLNSGRTIEINDFEYITYNGSNGIVEKVTTFENFYLYTRLLTFVGKESIATLSSKDIESIQFYGNFKE